MTLDTRILIIDPLPARDVFMRCRDLLGCTDRHEWREGEWDGLRYIGNLLGQGLPALLDVIYSPDGPLPTHAVFGDEAEEVRPCSGAIEVSFDTAYRYRADNGAGCEDLHAWLVRELGLWLEEQDVKCCWQNEFTGEWHQCWQDVTVLGNPDRGALR